VNKTWLSSKLDALQDVFEHASPSILSMLAVFLPYLTPIPIATLTAASAERFLGMSPGISFVFVFVLEGIGLWTTVIFVDSIVQFIKSRNTKTGVMVIILFAVVCIYITILVNLNVSLEESAKVVSPVYSRVITLICFLPLISGFMAGYNKIQNDYKINTEKETEYNRNLAEKLRQEKREDSLRNKMLKRGMMPTTFQANTVGVAQDSRPNITSSDWRVVNKQITPEQRQDIATLPVSSTASTWKISERTALNWRLAARKQLNMAN